MSKTNSCMSCSNTSCDTRSAEFNMIESSDYKCDISSCCDRCDKCKKHLSCSDKKTIIAIEKIIHYKKIQKETVCSLKNIASNLLSIIQNSYSCDISGSECFKPEALNTIEQYIRITNKTCDCKKIAFNGDGSVYATINDSYLPIYGESGFGGIRDSADISGNLIVNTNDDEILSFSMAEGDSVSLLASKINKKLCGQISVVNGLEFSLKFDTLGSCFSINLQKNKNDCHIYNFVVPPNSSDNDYCDLVDNIKNSFADYSPRIWYDHISEKIRFIFDSAYNVTISNNAKSKGSIFIDSYINDHVTSSNLIIPNNKKVLYGYLEFYSTTNKFIIEYPPNSINTFSTIVCMQSILPNICHFCDNVTLNLTNVWFCHFETIAKLNIQYDKCFRNIIDIKAFYSWGLLLRNIVNCLKFDCSHYDVWRRTNVSSSIMSLIKYLENIYSLVESQTELLIIIKHDFIEYCENC